MKLLSLKELEQFDYVKTRERVQEHVNELNMIKYKYMNVLPPSIASNLYEIKVQTSRSNNSSIERFVEKKDEFERLHKEKLSEIESAIQTLNIEEQRIIKDCFVHGISLTVIERQFKCGREAFERIKKSAVIKFALILDISVMKNETT